MKKEWSVEIPVNRDPNDINDINDNNDPNDPNDPTNNRRFYYADEN